VELTLVVALALVVEEDVTVAAFPVESPPPSLTKLSTRCSLPHPGAVEATANAEMPSSASMVVVRFMALRAVARTRAFDVRRE
jgi:hypothetical protein